MDPMGASIPHLKEPVDVLREGPTSLAVEASAPHPVQAFQASVRPITLVVCHAYIATSFPLQYTYKRAVVAPPQ